MNNTIILIILLLSVFALGGAIPFIIFFAKQRRQHIEFMNYVGKQMKVAHKQQAKMHKEYEEHKRKNDEFFKKFER